MHGMHNTDRSRSVAVGGWVNRRHRAGPSTPSKHAEQVRVNGGSNHDSYMMQID